MSAEVLCELCGGRMFRNQNTAGVVTNVRVCKHCDMPCKVNPCMACSRVSSRKNR